MMKRPDMRAYFGYRVNSHVVGMFSQRVPLPSGVARVIGDVTDREIIVVMKDGTEHYWIGGEYSTRKINGCYAPKRPKPVSALPLRS